MNLTAGSRTAIPVPKAYLNDILEASDSMLQSIFLGDRQRALDAVTKSLHDIIRAESCAVFLVTENSRQMMRIASSFTDKSAEAFDPAMPPIKIQSRERQGLTGHIANTGRITRLSGQELTSSIYYASISPEHLLSGKCKSLLAIPLKDRKDKLIGLLKLENKKGSDAHSTQHPVFSETDVATASIMANKIVLLLENLKTHDLVRGLIREMQITGGFDRLLNSLIRLAVIFMNADRGELALWSEPRSQLISAAAFELGMEPGKTSGAVPVLQRSIARQIWNARRETHFVCKDLKVSQHKYVVDARAVSAAAIRLELDGRSLGILTFEAFERNYFDAHDLESLSFLANYVAIVLQVATRQSTSQAFQRRALHALGKIPQKLPDLSNRKNLDTVLNAIQAVGFERGRVFTYLKSKKEFRCTASIESDQRDSYSKLTSRVADNHYAKDMLDSYQSNQRVRVYDPTDPRFFGIDPSANEFGKDPDLPWAAVPIIVDSELIGQITADNGHSKKPITPEGIEYLNLLAIQVSRSSTHARREKERASLRESETFYHGVIDQMGHRISRKDHDGKIIFVNQALCESLGLKREELIGKTDHDLFPKELADKYRRDDMQVLKGKALELEEEFKYPKGGTVTVRVIKTPVRNDSGAIIAVQVTFWEITQRTVTALLDSIPDSIYFKDNRSRFTRVSRSMVKLFRGYSAHSLIGKTDSAFFQKGNAQRKYKDEQLLLKGKKRIVRKVESEVFLDGRRREVSTIKLPLKAPKGGEIIGTFGISHDVTSREKVLRGLLKEKNALVHELHHRVQNNLLEEIAHLRSEERTTSDPAVRQALAKCRERVQITLDAYGHMLAASNMSSLSTTDYIGVLISRIFERYARLRPNVRSHKEVMSFRLGITVALPCAQILNEMITNAFKHAFPGDKKGVVSVKVSLDAQRIVTLVCADSGVGFGGKRRQKPKKTFGMKLVRMLVKKLDGNIKRTYTDEKNGTTITITFPLGKQYEPSKLTVC